MLPPIRYRLLLLLFVPIVCFWKADWLLEATTASYSDRYYSSRHEEPEPLLVEGTKVYASEDHLDTVFKVDNVRYRWTTIHANVLQEGKERHLEVLAFLEDLSYSGPISIHHQAIVPSKIEQVIEGVKCVYSSNNESKQVSTPATLQYKMPHAWYAVLVRCEVPAKLSLPTTMSLELFSREKTTVKHNINLKTYLIREGSHVPNLALCLSPMFGDIDMFRILEWRLHHARMGVKTVHWYTRYTNKPLETLITILNHEEDLQDTWKEAPPLSPDTFETGHLQEKGLYGDQVLYYIDCLERSKHLNPTHWLGFVDLDEFFLPDPFDLSGIDDFLDLKNHSDIATICFDRNQVARPTDKDGDEKTELLFEHIEGLVERKEDHPTDNRKCVHRPSNLLVPFVHWPLLLRDGKSHKGIIYSSEGEYLRLLHASSKEYWGERIPLVRNEAYQQYISLLRKSIEYYLHTYSHLFQ